MRGPITVPRALREKLKLRLLLRDDAAPAKKAEQALLRHARGDGGFLPLVVLVETAWVLVYA